MNFDVGHAEPLIAIAAPAPAAGPDAALLVCQWRKEERYLLREVSAGRVNALPALDQSAIAQAWEGAMELLRKRGENPSDTVQAAARSMREWIDASGKSDGPLDPDES
jgi:hypothetical protein